MAINREAYFRLNNELQQRKITLVAVSKTKPVEDIQELYQMGHRDFGENYVQELTEKQSRLPDDIRWHFIGHLQTNKVKYIASFIHLIHAVDSLKLLNEISKQAKKNNRIIDCLLQVHIAQEETKFGLDEQELHEFIRQAENLTTTHARVVGLMGMASFTEDAQQVRKELKSLQNLYEQYPQFHILSMGMSSDYKIAVEEGTNLVRVGSLLFGERI